MAAADSQVTGYRKLIAWQKGMDLVDAVYDVAAMLPLEERFELSSQMRRASVSVPSNLAEGYCRRPRAWLNHIEIAQGSVGELDTQVEICLRRRFIPAAAGQVLFARIIELRKILQGLSASIERRYNLRDAS